MRFPQRSDTHKIEAASWRLLQELAPDEWIVREVSERDYGVDAYIEITTASGDVTGNLVSIQLKGVQGLDWKDGEGQIKTARSPSIKTTTANYWLNLPVPVFLFVAELSTRKIFYVPVEESIRSQFENLSKQDSITFKLMDELNIKSDIGSLLFDWFVARERAHSQFVFHITNLLSHIDSFRDFILYNQNRDSFMEVEGDRHLQLRALYETCRMASLYLEREWKVDSLKDLYRKDRQEWNDPYVLLHERTLDHVLSQLETIFPELVRKALELVTVAQAAYWRKRNPVFFHLCNNGELSWSLKAFEQRVGAS